MSVIFEKTVPGRKGVSLPECDVPVKGEVPEAYRRAVTAWCDYIEDGTPAPGKTLAEVFRDA